jgi:hypothetical protein
MLQRTEEWFKQREGKFTASQTKRLLAKENPKKTVFGIICTQGLSTYAFEKAVEKIYGHKEQEFISFDTQRGNDLEPLAFKRFKEIKELEFIDVEETGFHSYCENSGASPDALVSDNSILEIKCPKRDIFFKIVANGIDEVDSIYIAQMQMQMMSTNTEKAYFFNFFIDEGVEYWHTLIIQRDELMIELIKERISKAVIIRDKFIEKIKNNAQF